jgi:hypothetical protein
VYVNSLNALLTQRNKQPALLPSFWLLLLPLLLLLPAGNNLRNQGLVSRLACSCKPGARAVWAAAPFKGSAAAATF